MYISRIFLEKFRNIKRVDMELNPNVNIFWGFNGQGKTNFLESIYLLARASSPRAFSDNELIGWGEDYFFVKGRIHDDLNTFNLSIGYAGGRKKINIDEKALNRHKELLGKFLVVFFTPEDLQLVKGPPTIRRNFLDQEISFLFPLYYDNLRRYKSVVLQRNNLLKAIKIKNKKEADLEPWDDQLAKLGAEIILKRISFLNEIKPIIQEKYLQIADGHEELSLEYSPLLPLDLKASLSDWQQAIGQALKRRRREEIIRGTTLVGPHRDELIFFLSTKDLRNYGSQGQQRSAVLALKLSEIEYISKVTKKKPVLLLDDVFSELDSKRRAALLALIEDNIQTIITTTDQEFKVKNLSFSFFRVCAGEITGK